MIISCSVISFNPLPFLHGKNFAFSEFSRRFYRFLNRRKICHPLKIDFLQKRLKMIIIMTDDETSTRRRGEWMIAEGKMWK